MNAPFSAFEMMRVINLRSRPDRRAEMEAELRRIGLHEDPRVRFIDAVAPDEQAPFRSRGEKGCFLSHLTILREAAECSASVLILEDDADFTEAARQAGPSEPFDIFYGGYIAFTPERLQESDIMGTHCMGFSASAAAVLVPYLEGLLRLDDPPPIDGAYIWFRRNHPQLVTLFADPVLALQRPSRSDIASLRFFDRLPGLRVAASLARRIKRSAERGEISFGMREASVVAVAGTLIAVIVAIRALG